jgi:hypothetical protein
MHDITTYARRVERNAGVLTIILIVAAVLGLIVGIALMFQTAGAVCFDDACSGQDHPYLGFGIAIIAVDIVGTAFSLTLASYLRMRAHATARQFGTPVAPPLAQPGGYAQPGAFT